MNTVSRPLSSCSCSCSCSYYSPCFPADNSSLPQGRCSVQPPCLTLPNRLPSRSSISINTPITAGAPTTSSSLTKRPSALPLLFSSQQGLSTASTPNAAKPNPCWTYQPSAQRNSSSPPTKCPICLKPATKSSATLNKALSALANRNSASPPTHPISSSSRRSP